MDAAPARAAGADLAGLADGLRRAFDRYAYRARQYGLTLSLAVPGRLWGLVLSPNQPGFDAHVLGLLQRRYEGLLERDLANVESGDYPRDLLYQLPLLSYLRQLPVALSDLPRFLWRRGICATTWRCCWPRSASRWSRASRIWYRR